MHVQEVFSRAGIVHYCLRVSLGRAATLFEKALVCGVGVAAFAMCVDAWVGYLQ
jgi:hypothetical protein